MPVRRPLGLRDARAVGALGFARLQLGDQGVVDRSRTDGCRTRRNPLGIGLEGRSGGQALEHQAPGDLAADIDVGGGEPLAQQPRALVQRMFQAIDDLIE